jgi:hypothetical protein
VINLATIYSPVRNPLFLGSLVEAQAEVISMMAINLMIYSREAPRLI